MEEYKTLNVRFDIIARTNLVSGKSSWFTMYLLPKVEGNLEPNDVIARAELSNEVKDGLLVSLDISNMGGREVVVAIGNMIGSNQDVKYHAKIREVWLEP